MDNIEDNKMDFLTSAINQIHTNITFLDTKVTLLLGVAGIVVAAIVECREDIYDVFFGTSGVVRMVMIIVAGIFIVNLGMMIYYSIRCINPRHQKDSNRESEKKIWYLDEEINYQAYLNNINTINMNEQIIEMLAYELFSLNKINLIKSENVKKAVCAFEVAIFALLVLVALCVGINFLWGYNN